MNTKQHKMKNFLIVILVTLINTNLFGQVYKLEYKFGDNMPMVGYSSYNAILEYNTKTKESVYTVLKKGIKTENSTDDNMIMLGNDIIDDIVIYNNFKDSLTLTQDQIDIEMMIFKEKTPKIKWLLTDETKIKNNLNLKKATSNFRGRNYEVWYTLDIPVSIGPWKLNGLPGAIVEAKENINRYSWELVKFSKLKEDEFKKFYKNPKYKEYDIKFYPKYKFSTPERIKEKLRKIDSNFQFPEPERDDIELKFEWEK